MIRAQSAHIATAGEPSNHIITERDYCFGFLAFDLVCIMGRYSARFVGQLSNESPVSYSLPRLYRSRQEINTELELFYYKLSGG